MKKSECATHMRTEGAQLTQRSAVYSKPRAALMVVGGAPVRVGRR